MRNAQMSGALVKALDTQLAQIALKNIANHKSIALEPQFFLLSWLRKYIKKISQENTQMNIK